jgi:peptide-methionine (S)-S-oxide reductase
MKMIKKPFLLIFIPLFIMVLILFLAVSQNGADSAKQKTRTDKEHTMNIADKGNLETAVVGGGCFWCLEAVFERVEGVVAVRAGYAGGTVGNPSYEEVCTGSTGHAEVVEITYDDTLISYDEILDIFWLAHDPTTLNRQGNDVGTQYRSIILYRDDEQKKAALESKNKAPDKLKLTQPIVTEIKPLTVFYPAEDYHQDYYDNNRGQGYCIFVIHPKLKKLGLE